MVKSYSRKVGIMAVGMREWMALVATLAMLLAAATGYGTTTTPCHEAYLMSGLSERP